MDRLMRKWSKLGGACDARDGDWLKFPTVGFGSCCLGQDGFILLDGRLCTADIELEKNTHTQPPTHPPRKKPTK